MASRAKSILILFLTALLLSLLFVRSAPAELPSKTAGPRTVVDQAGRTVVVREPVDRIVSGYYISTSVCLALDIADRLAGIEAGAETRPIYALSRPALLELTSVGTAKDFNIEACIALNPGLVILPYRQRDTAETLVEMGIPAIVVNPESYEDMIGMIGLIGAATDADERADLLIEWIRRGRENIDERVSGLAYRPGTYFAGVNTWLMTASVDMFQAELIEISGGRNVAEVISGSSWAEISYEQLLAMDPEVIIIPSEASYDIEDLYADPMLKSLTAIRNDFVFKMPSFIEAWDSPIPASMLGARWLFEILTLHEQNFNDIYLQEIPLLNFDYFYMEFYGFDARDALNQVLGYDEIHSAK